MSIERLLSLKDENDRKGIEMLTESGQFAALAGRHENGLAPRAVSGFNLFQTPEIVADDMASRIPEDLGPEPMVLEPSAGLGRLYRAVKKRIPEAKFSLVENSPECAAELYKIKEAHLKQCDFLSLNPPPVGEGFDLVIMNPPFKMGTDIKHILHARKFLKKTGLLISLCFDGTRQNNVLKPLAATWEILPADSFKSEGTRAGVVLLTLKSGG